MADSKLHLKAEECLYNPEEIITNSQNCVDSIPLKQIVKVETDNN